MAYGIIGYGSAGATNALPSGNIWGDCSSQELIDEGTGFFVDADFTTAVIATDASGLSTAVGTGGSLISMPSAADNTAAFLINITTALVPPAPQALAIVQDTTTAHAAAIWTYPMGGGGVAGSLIAGKKFWCEISLTPVTQSAGSAVSSDAWFFGLVGLGNSTQYGMVKNFAKVSSATQGSNSLQSVSCIGFWKHGDSTVASTKVDLVFLNLTTVSATATTYTNMTTGVVASGAVGSSGFIQKDVTNAASFVANGGVAFNMTAKTFTKFGLRYDGQQYLYGYVNGVQVSKTQVAGTLDALTDFGVIFSNSIAGSGPVACEYDIAFFRAAAKVL
jgi:hypothetical protein